MRNLLFISYFFAIHLLLIIVLIKTDFLLRAGYRFSLIDNIQPEFTACYEQTKKILDRMDANTPDGSVIFIGSSLIQGLSVAAVAREAVNFGIGTDTTAGVLNRLSNYKSIRQASALVIYVGGNDFKRRNNDEILKNYSEITQLIPPQVPVVVNAILPVDENARSDLAGRNARSKELNSRLKLLCANRAADCLFLDPTTRFIDSSGNLKKQYHDGDGVHLNGSGNLIWIQELKEVVRKAKELAAPVA
jgi:lysophospholipase L1-like esterase